jgi:hypothetical protein
MSAAAAKHTIGLVGRVTEKGSNSVRVVTRVRNGQTLSVRSNFDERSLLQLAAPIFATATLSPELVASGPAFAEAKG